MKLLLTILVIAITFADAKTRPKAARPKLTCTYDNMLYQTAGSVTISQTSTTACRESYVYSSTRRNIALTLTNITISCNGFNDIELYDQNGRLYYYCDYNPRPSVVNWISKNVNWIAVTRYGSVRFTMLVQFPSVNTSTIVPVTNSSVAPITSGSVAPITSGSVAPITSGSVAPITNASASTCGRQAIRPDETGLRIVGGSFAIPNSWPWQVSLFSGSFFCGGSIINNQWILTAAHCQVSTTNLIIRTGDHDISTSTDGETSHRASRWISHPSYNGNTLVNDIALIRLNAPITFSNRASPVCLPGGRRPVVGQLGVVTGWGTTAADGNGQISNILKQVVIPILPSSAATALYGSLPSTQIYAGTISNTNPGDSCQGDSGGPFVLRDSTGAYYQTGVVSYGVRCAGNGVYTNVVDYEQWIADTIRANP